MAVIFSAIGQHLEYGRQPALQRQRLGHLCHRRLQVQLLGGVGSQDPLVRLPIGVHLRQQAGAEMLGNSRRQGAAEGTWEQAERDHLRGLRLDLLSCIVVNG